MHVPVCTSNPTVNRKPCSIYHHVLLVTLLLTFVICKRISSLALYHIVTTALCQIFVFEGGLYHGDS